MKNTPKASKQKFIENKNISQVNIENKKNSILNSQKKSIDLTKKPNLTQDFLKETIKKTQIYIKLPNSPNMSINNKRNLSVNSTKSNENLEKNVSHFTSPKIPYKLRELSLEKVNQNYSNLSINSTKYIKDTIPYKNPANSIKEKLDLLKNRIKKAFENDSACIIELKQKLKVLSNE